MINATIRVSTARALADTFASMRELGIANRDLFDAILRETLDRNPEYMGVWTVWEPNALDGRDRDFQNAPGHDESGRYIPFWNRGGGRIHLEANLGYNVPGLGDWYLLPRQLGAETVLDPYEFPFAGRPEFITSQVAPIYFRGKWVGAAGVDVAMDDFVSSMRMEESLHRGFIFLDEQGGVDYWSGRTRDLLSQYTGRRLDRELPASIASHVYRLQLSGDRGIRCNPTPLPPLRRGEKILNLKFLKHPQNGRYLIILEEKAAPEVSLSIREREVLEWLGQGKSNSEIGIILGISLHTVKRHLERVLQKVGAENRYAAALVGLGMK